MKTVCVANTWYYIIFLLSRIFKNLSINHTVALIDMYLHYTEHFFVGLFIYFFHFNLIHCDNAHKSTKRVCSSTQKTPY